MAYTTAAKVQELAPMLGTIGTTTRVTTTGLTGIMAAVDAEIDVALQSVGYSAPYAEAGPFLTWLQKLATDGATARLYKAWFMDTSGTGSQNQGRDLLMDYRAGLASIRDRTMVPVSIGEASASLPSSNAAVAPVFIMGQVF